MRERVIVVVILVEVRVAPEEAERDIIGFHPVNQVMHQPVAETLAPKFLQGADKSDLPRPD